MDKNKSFSREKFKPLTRLVHPNIVHLEEAFDNESEEKTVFMIIVEKLSEILGDISQEMQEFLKIFLLLS